MDCYAVERIEVAKPSGFARVLESLAQVFTRHAEPSSRLDLEDVPDRVKRDLGFLDGREPRYQDDRLR